MLEEQEERLLQKILFEITQTLEAIARTDAEIEGSNAMRRADIHKPIIGHDVHASYSEIAHFKQIRAELESRIEKLHKLRDQQLLVYEAARRNREMLTDMCEDKRTAYNAEMARSEQKVLDDNYIGRHGRF
jgi:flagellar biosynthesis chaperone FliJ